MPSEFLTPGRFVDSDSPLSEILGTLHELYGPGMFGGEDAAGDPAGPGGAAAQTHDPASPGGTDRTGDLFAAPTS